MTDSFGGAEFFAAGAGASDALGAGAGEAGGLEVLFAVTGVAVGVAPPEGVHDAGSQLLMLAGSGSVKGFAIAIAIPTPHNTTSAETAPPTHTAEVLPLPARSRRFPAVESTPVLASFSGIIAES